MLVELLTLGSVLINVGYQLPQVLLLRKKAAESSKGAKSPLNANTILIKTTGLYLACGYFVLNEVPILLLLSLPLSACHYRSLTVYTFVHVPQKS